MTVSSPFIACKAKLRPAFSSISPTATSSSSGYLVLFPILDNIKSNAPSKASSVLLLLVCSIFYIIYFLAFVMDLIADVAHGVDETALETAVHFAPEIADINIDHVGVIGKVISPNMLTDHGAGADQARTPHHIVEQAVFLA